MRPALLQIAEKSRVEMDPTDAPAIARLHVLVILNTAADERFASVFADHIHLPHSRPGDKAVRGHMDHRLILDAIVHLAIMHSLRTVKLEASADLGPAEIDASQPLFQRAVFGKEVGGIVPLPFIYVVAIRVVQVLDCLNVRERAQPAANTVQFFPQSFCLR